MEEPISVPAGEVQRRFALWQDRALTQPVAITSRGRPRVVMISAEEFERLRRRDCGCAGGGSRGDGGGAGAGP